MEPTLQVDNVVAGVKKLGVATHGVVDELHVRHLGAEIVADMLERGRVGLGVKGALVIAVEVGVGVLVASDFVVRTEHVSEVELSEVVAQLVETLVPFPVGNVILERGALEFAVSSKGSHVILP